jgi:osmoprotectant transport system permease protein
MDTDASLNVSVFSYIADNWDQIGPQIVTHLEIVAECIVLTSLIGLGLGIAATRSEPLSTLILAVTSTILTIPSFALFGLLSIWFGLANPPVIIGLVLYGLLPVTRNTRAGILSVDPAVREAARGMGMNPRQVLLKVELPLAVPVVLGGIRQATVMIVAIATVGATVGVNDLGQTILGAIGRSTGTLDAVLAGIIPVAAIGILADLILAGIQRALSRGRVSVAAT